MTVSSGNPKVILVMGVTGAGKSYLIRDISGQQVKVGDSLESCTQEVAQVNFDFEGQSVTFLDTPGFDDTHRTDAQVLEDVAKCLERLYSSDFLISGIIYLHNIEEVRMRGSAVKNLKLFSKLCGQDSYQNVVMLSGRWNQIDSAKAESNETELRNTFWRPYVTMGCRMDRYKNRNDLVRILRTLVRNDPVALDIQVEMVDEHKKLSETSAGEEVNADIVKLKQEYESQLEDIRADYSRQTAAMKEEMDRERQALQTAVERLNADMNILNERHEAAAREAQANLNFMEERNRINLAREREKHELRIQLNNSENDKARLKATLDYHVAQQEALRKKRPAWMFWKTNR